MVIEVMYNENEQEENKEHPDVRSLRNIRQIGTTNGKGRLYIEDRVKSYIDQYRNAETPRVLVLLGKERKQDGVCFFIDGVMVLEQAEIAGNEIKIPDLLEKLLWEEREIYFPHSRVLGFCLPAYSHVLDLVTRWEHQPTVFLTRDENEEEIFYIWEHSRFMPQSGYYIYYEDNQPMKEYAESHPCPVARQRRRAWERTAKASEQAGEDKRTEERKEANFPSFNGFLYVASAAMVIVVLVVGITLMSNYEKMYQLQQSMDTIVQAVSGSHVVTRTAPPETIPPVSPGPEQTPEAASSPSPEPTELTVSARNIDTVAPSEQEPAGAGQAGGFEIYTVQEGDTLSSICRDRYSSEHAVEQIRMLNDLKSENELQVGEKILLP